MSTLPPDGTLIVPVANPETADRLLATAIDLAQDRSMHLLVLHVVEVPAQVPLSEGDALLDGDDDPRELLDDAAQRCDTAGIEADTRLRYARNVASGIVGAVTEHAGDGLLMGWRGRPRRRDIVLGSFLDRVLAEAECDVFIKRIKRPPTDIESILVPVADGPHGAVSVAVAAALTRRHDATLSLVHVVPEDASETRLDEADSILARHLEAVADADVAADSATVRGAHVAGTITDLTSDYDLTILGATRGGFLGRKLVGSVAEGVGRAATSQVIVTRGGPDATDA